MRGWMFHSISFLLATTVILSSSILIYADNKIALPPLPPVQGQLENTKNNGLSFDTPVLKFAQMGFIPVQHIVADTESELDADSHIAPANNTQTVQTNTVNIPNQTLRPGLPVYKYAYTVFNPNPQNNPGAKDFPGNRGSNQIVIYTPDFPKPTTGTNSFGAEVVVRDGIVESIECCNSNIPGSGLIISAHGSAGEWIKKKIQPGMQVMIDEVNHILLFQNTPEALLKKNQQYLAEVQNNGEKINNDTSFKEKYQAANLCISQLNDKVTMLSTQDVTREQMQAVTQQADECTQLTDEAYFATIQPIPGEFRGVWLRPLEKTPEQVEQSLKRLDALHIHDIFIETYYQGKTIYPSQVMAAYGLDNQHARFRGFDPLAEWVTLAHQHGIKVHAWTQIFFAGNKDENAELYGPILNKYPQWANIPRTAICPGIICKPATIDPKPESKAVSNIVPSEANKTNALKATPPSTNVITSTPVAALPISPIASTVEPGHYFVDPSNPEVRLFLKKILTEIVSNYDVDGINLDYIRYPATPPVQSGSFLQANWGYTPTARKQFIAMLEKEALDKEKLVKTEIKVSNKPSPNKAKTLPVAKSGIAPVDPLRFDPARLTPSNSLWERWVSFRKDQVTSFVAETTQQLRQIKPNLYLSAVVFPIHDKAGFQIKLQDWPKWVESGYLNALTPIGLYPTAEGIFRDSMLFREVTQDKIPVYVGIFGAYNRIRPADFVAQIDAAHQAGMPGVMLFEHSRLSQPYREALEQGPFRE